MDGWMELICTFDCFLFSFKNMLCALDYYFILYYFYFLCFFRGNKISLGIPSRGMHKKMVYKKKPAYCSLGCCHGNAWTNRWKATLHLVLLLPCLSVEKYHLDMHYLSLSQFKSSLVSPQGSDLLKPLNNIQHASAWFYIQMISYNRTVQCILKDFRVYNKYCRH